MIIKTRTGLLSPEARTLREEVMPKMTDAQRKLLHQAHAASICETSLRFCMSIDGPETTWIAAELGEDNDAVLEATKKPMLGRILEPLERVEALECFVRAMYEELAQLDPTIRERLAKYDVILGRVGLINAPASGGKYYRRVLTGNPEIPYKYFATPEEFEEYERSSGNASSGATIE